MTTPSDRTAGLAASVLLFIASSTLPAQQSSTATVQEHLNTSDSLEATVTSPSGDIKAGEDFQFTVRLRTPPNFEGGGVVFTTIGTNGTQSGFLCAEKHAELPHSEYVCVVHVPNTAPGGIWIVQDLYFSEGGSHMSLGFKPITFRVIPNPNVIIPTSAEVTINLNQKQLLRREAGRLQVRIQQLKSRVSEYIIPNQHGALTPVLQQNLSEALGALKSTQTEFSKLTTREGERTNEEVFFDDLRRGYEGVISHLDKSKARAGRPRKTGARLGS